MSRSAHQTRYSMADYLRLEETSNVRHEYLDGQIFALAGGTPEHAALAATVSGLLFGQLRGGRCRVFDADLRVRVLATGLATYPDLTVVCGPLERDPEDPNSVTNPTLVVEVLSPSTEEYDRGDKLLHYQQIPALQQVCLVRPQRGGVEVWTREMEDGWSRCLVDDGEIVSLPALEATIDVKELYDSAEEPAAHPAADR